MARRLMWWFASFVALVLGAYFWQPYRYDLFPREGPSKFVPINLDTKDLFRPGARVTVITAHPDDSEFYIGGLLTRLAKSGAYLSLVVCTSGDKSYNPFVNHSKTITIRHAEQDRAADRWNARERYFLSHPDGRMVVDDNLLFQLSDFLSRFKPDYILCFDSEYPPRLSHRDHRAAGEAAEKAVLKSGVGKWLMRFSTRAPNYIVDVSKEFENKKELLHIHKSEFSGEKRLRIDEMITRNAQGDGSMIHVQLGEGLRCTQLDRTNVPMSSLPVEPHLREQR